MNNLEVFFKKIRIVSLPERVDRRREVENELERIGLSADEKSILFFDAIKPDSKAGFPSIGARGCFLSHLKLLTQSRDCGDENVLVLEDDVNFVKDFAGRIDGILSFLSSDDWDICYLGHTLELGERTEIFIPYEGGVQTTHSYAVRGAAIGKLVDFLEVVLSREPGHPLGGPMHVDGAISTFRQQNPDIKTIVLVKPLTYQRPSRTDIHDLKIYDRLSFLRPFTGFLRRLRRRN